ncbi:MAG: polyprenyl synthetase family protein [Bacteroidaceae bacterium]|nr:polyprenyl synthetase family protein [Bacteroidaceae bacterium]
MISKINAALDALKYPKQPRGLYEPIRYALEEGGKRVRPRLLLLTYSLYSDDTERAMPAAIGIETYHNYTLLHDDVMDNAEMRRGRPTVHVKWDQNTAILSGDVMLMLALRYVSECRCKRWAELRDVFIQSCIEVGEGQQYDMNFEKRDEVAVDESLEMIRLKTSVLVACAAKMGAIAANAPEEDCELIYAFAERIGMAFQLQDDYLDVYGDPAVFGKKIGGDILCGKKTYLLISALNHGDEGQRMQLLNLINDKNIADQDKIKAVTDIYNAIGIPEICKNAIEAYYDDARNLYETLPLPENKKAPLWAWATELLERKK